MGEPASRPTTVAATDGFELAATVFEPRADVECAGAVVIAAGTAIRRSFYVRFADYLVSEGFRVITFDYRGIGDSRPKSLRKFRAHMHEWGEKDVAGVLEWTQRFYAPPRLLVVGHSAGGQMVGLAPNNGLVTAMATVSAQSGYWGLWDAPLKYGMAALWYVLIPGGATLWPYFPAKRLGLGEDLPKGVALEWARWCRNPHFIVDPAQRPIREDFSAFRAPILSYSFDDDRAAPRRAVEALHEFYQNASTERRHVHPSDLGLRSIGHFGFFREELRESLWRETAAWLKGQKRSASTTTRPPSGDERQHHV